MIEMELSAHCSCEKESVSLGCGIYFNPEEEPINTIGVDWLWIGMSECFWENYHEFEPGIIRAKAILNNSKEMTYRQALFNVFGYFSVTFNLDGKNIDYDICANFNDAIYDMLEEA